ncbi:MAG TPA: hypothetical protein VJI69_00810 [Bacteroidia bacterium]|nr:hypothetical protein [Bacteroidia bacterium]
MNRFSTFFLFFLLILSATTFSQNYSADNYRGTIRIKKIIPNKYIISAETSLKRIPEMRTFRVRGYNYNFKEYFPKEYDSELFPLVFNYTGLILVNENKQEVGAEIISFEYDIVKSNVIIHRGLAVQGNLNHSIKTISKMMVGSCVWIKNLTYKDKNGVIHNNKIGEFKIEKVK